MVMMDTMLNSTLNFKDELFTTTGNASAWARKVNWICAEDVLKFIKRLYNFFLKDSIHWNSNQLATRSSLISYVKLDSVCCEYYRKVPLP